jgi:xylulokinase
MSLQHRRADMLRAILEGVALNTRWMMTPFSHFLGRSLDRITMVGGGAKSDLWCQIFADILGIHVQQVEAPIQANAVGAAFIGAVGIGALTMPDISSLTRLRKTYLPDASRKDVYEELFSNFQLAHRRLAPLYRRMNQRKTEAS